MSTTTTPLTALVFGASGITGHAILKTLLTYPTPSTFARIIGLTNRPLTTADSHLKADQRVELYSGIDLLDREKSLLQLQHVPGIQQVTHVYYASYAGHGQDFEELKRVNSELLTNAIGGVEICCPDLRFVTLNTGGKAYGIEFHTSVPFNPPLREDHPRIPEPYASNIFYYAQHDILMRASAGKPWSFCEIRPDVIVGFVPRGNFMNMAQGLAIYFSLYREAEGEGAEVRFPYGEEAWTALHTDSSADILGRFHVYASLAEPVENIVGRAFNVVDGPAFAWRDLWPRLAAYFGLVGTGPSTGIGGQVGVQDWVHAKKDVWEKLETKSGLKAGVLKETGFDFVDAVMRIPVRRDFDSSARKSIGFTEERDPVEGYVLAFEEMRKTRIIP